MKTIGGNFLMVEAVVALVLVQSAAYAQVIADPDSVTFTTQQDSKTITLTSYGEPVPASAIGQVQFLVGDHTYEHMIKVEKRDGAIVVTPDTMESGWYTLVIHTDMGQATVAAYAPLAHIAETLEERATALGITVDELKERLGLTQQSKREIIDIELPPVYYEGQSIIVTAPDTPDAVHIWAINGKVVYEGPGANRLIYVLTEPGDLILTYVKKINDVIVASDTAATRVIAQPGVQSAVTVNRKVVLSAPMGYGAYLWTLDGEQVGTGRLLEHTFTEPGIYTVVCEARGGASGIPDTYRRVTYRITVEPTSM
jgi:hypothetical protein